MKRQRDIQFTYVFKSRKIFLPNACKDLHAIVIDNIIVIQLSLLLLL